MQEKARTVWINSINWFIPSFVDQSISILHEEQSDEAQTFSAIITRFHYENSKLYFGVDTFEIHNQIQEKI